MGKPPSNRFQVTAIVAGEPVNVTVNENAPVHTLVEAALKESQNTGRPLDDWIITDIHGNPIDMNSKVGDAGIVAGATVVISLKSGVTG